jgi:hypothetical protein
MKDTQAAPHIGALTSCVLSFSKLVVLDKTLKIQYNSVFNCQKLEQTNL